MKHEDDDDTQGYIAQYEAALLITYQSGFADGKKAAQRPWAGLEAEDLAQIESDEFWQTGNHMAIALAVEAKLKERNT